MNEGSRRAILYAFFANLGVAIAKFVAFLVTGASSMLAEAVHSVADTSNQGLLLLGGSLSQRKPTPEHPFGFGRERYFWSFIVALLLFTMGSLFALYEGVERLRHPHEIVSPAWAIGVLVFAAFLEAFSLRAAYREADRIRRRQSWWEFVRHAKTPELPVVLLEDLGALLGLVFAMIGVGLASLTGDARFDALGTLAIGLLLGAIAIILAIEMKSLLIGESASPANEEAIRDAIESSAHVRRIIHMRTQHLGPEELLVAAKVDMDRYLDVPGLAAAIDEIEAEVRERVPVARLIYLEPDVHRPAPTPESPPSA